jgi:hypothetical protein
MKTSRSELTGTKKFDASFECHETWFVLCKGVSVRLNVNNIAPSKTVVTVKELASRSNASMEGTVERTRSAITGNPGQPAQSL